MKITLRRSSHLDIVNEGVVNKVESPASSRDGYPEVSCVVTIVTSDSGILVVRAGLGGCSSAS